MSQIIYQVDAFANNLFKGNPAAFCMLEEWIPDTTMQSIAMENNLAETAFVVRLKEDNYELRWFTPSIEVNLCGHATLAAAHILFSEYKAESNSLNFDTKSGRLIVQKIDVNNYSMDFPSDEPLAINDFQFISNVINTDIKECYRGKDDFLIILENENAVIKTIPNYPSMSQIDSRGIIISAPGKEKDFVSRCFFPNVGVNEDPVTGSAHTLLTPYWAHRLNKNVLDASQLSSRGGDIRCIYRDNRVSLIGSAITYMKGEIYI